MHKELPKSSRQRHNFTNDLPGGDWVTRFKKCHSHTTRLCSNIKLNRAEKDTISQHFHELSKVVEDVDGKTSNTLKRLCG